LEPEIPPISVRDMKLLTWNVAWANTKKWPLIKETIASHEPDIVCLTEALTRHCFDGYHWIESHPDYGYHKYPNRRKVLLGSTDQWRDTSTGMHLDIPTGRLACGTTHGIEVLGVCIPWKDAHVRTGREDREPWQDHLTYLTGIKDEVHGRIVVGDLNQRIPQKLQPQKYFEALSEVLGGHNIPTKWPDLTTSEGKRHIDHIALPVGFIVDSVTTIPKLTDDGTKLSDHDGIVLQFNQRG